MLNDIFVCFMFCTNRGCATATVSQHPYTHTLSLSIVYGKRRVERVVQEQNVEHSGTEQKNKTKNNQNNKQTKIKLQQMARQ